MNLGCPSQGFLADNGGKFANIKLDELTSTLGLTVKFGHFIHHGPIASMKGTMQA